MVAAVIQLYLVNGKFLLNVKRNPFSRLEKESCIAVHHMADTLQSLPSFFSFGQPHIRVS